MAFKYILLAACIAVAQAGLVAPLTTYSAAPAVSHISYSSPIVSYGTPAITTQSQNILRSYGNLGQVSTYSKTIDTPFSSVSKSDVRVSNPGLKISSAPALAYAAPAFAAPITHHYAAPQTISAPSAIGVAYSAAPAVAHVTYSNGYGINYAW